jgi:predicted SnoaL-like aldol condensation-catalyzing enzyme
MNRREVPVSATDVVSGATGVYNARELDRANEFIAAGAVDHSTYGGSAPGPEGVVLGLDGWRRRWEAAWRGVSDMEVTVERTVASGDTVARLLRTRGTRDGRAFELSGMDIVRVRDGRIVEHWAVVDAG